MEDMRVNNSRWARFTVKKPIGKLSEPVVKFWKRMKLEFITHYHSEESRAVIVIAKALVSHRRTKWNKFLKLLNGSSLEMCKVKRYHSPIKDLRGTAHEDEVHKNLFTVEMNDALPDEPPEREETPKKKKKSKRAEEDEEQKKKKTKLAKQVKTEARSPIQRLMEMEVVSGKILPSATKRGALQKTTLEVFGQEWSRGSCVDLRVFWMLEAHRRILGLEHFLATRGVERRLPELRALALTTRKYILIDPITLALPMLLGHLRGSFDIQADATYRLLAVAASLGPLLRYGVELSVVARGRLSDQHLAEATPFLFDWPFTFLPDGMRATLAAGQMVDAPASITRRIEKEQALPRPPCRALRNLET